jgi:hypothetical protein
VTRVVGAAPKFDLIFVAGDTLSIRSTVPLDVQSVVVLKYLSLLESVGRVAVSSGNHDLTGPDEEGEQTALWLDEARTAGVSTDGDSLVVGDTLVTLCPWWDGPKSKAAVARQLARDSSRRGSRWIWVYHWPPLGSPACWTGRRDYGDADLGGWIAEHHPDAVLTGHVHESPFKSDGSWADRIGHTWIFNAGNQIGLVPARVELDFTKRHARWVALLGTEDINLAATAVPARTIF